MAYINIQNKKFWKLNFRFSVLSAFTPVLPFFSQHLRDMYTELSVLADQLNVKREPLLKRNVLLKTVITRVFKVSIKTFTKYGEEEKWMGGGYWRHIKIIFRIIYLILCFSMWMFVYNNFWGNIHDPREEIWMLKIAKICLQKI